MTEQEAMEVLKQPCLCDYDLSNTVLDCDIKQCDKRDAVLQAIKALEEICQYRAIGTPDECRAAVEKLRKVEEVVKEWDKVGYSYSNNHMCEIKMIVKDGGVDMKNNMKCYTQGNADNIDKAVEGLDIFTKNWCMNCAETEKTNDLVFRCKECDFAEESGSCRIKGFVNKHKSNYPLDDFGSMGRH